MKAFERTLKTGESVWNEARGKATGRVLAFVVDAPHVRRLTDPSQLWGVPILPLLREMGFAVEVICHGQVQKSRTGLSFFRTPDELGTLLREGRFDAVYSEYDHDLRLSRAGKSQFALDCFEMGIAGGRRTLQRLNEICSWPFYRRYGNYL
jgi:hypothetical protein